MRKGTEPEPLEKGFAEQLGRDKVIRTGRETMSAGEFLRKFEAGEIRVNEQSQTRLISAPIAKTFVDQRPEPHQMILVKSTSVAESPSVLSFFRIDEDLVWFFGGAFCSIDTKWLPAEVVKNLFE